jgi:hypothetical protein
VRRKKKKKGKAVTENGKRAAGKRVVGGVARLGEAGVGRS